MLQQGSSFYHQMNYKDERKPNLAMTSELVLGKKNNDQRLELPTSFMNDGYGVQNGIKKPSQAKLHLQNDFLAEQNGNIRKPLIPEKDIDMQTKKLNYEIDALDKALHNNKNGINERDLDNLKLDTASNGVKTALPPRIRGVNQKNGADEKVQLVIPDFNEKPSIKIQKNDNQENKKPKQQLVLRDNYDQNLEIQRPRIEQTERQNNFQQKPSLNNAHGNNQPEQLPNWLRMDNDDEKQMEQPMVQSKPPTNHQQPLSSNRQQGAGMKPNYQTSEAYVPNIQNNKQANKERQMSKGKKTEKVVQIETKLAVATGVQQVPKIEIDENEELIECPEGCGRSFNQKALEKHIPICKKIFQDKRSEFNTQKQRIVDSEQAKLLRQAKMKDKKEKKQQQLRTTDKQQKNGKNWKEESEQLRKMIKEKAKQQEKN